MAPDAEAVAPVVNPQDRNPGGDSDSAPAHRGSPLAKGASPAAEAVVSRMAPGAEASPPVVDAWNHVREGDAGSAQGQPGSIRARDPPSEGA